MWRAPRIWACLWGTKRLLQSQRGHHPGPVCPGALQRRGPRGLHPRRADFRDVPAGKVVHHAVAWASEMGVVAGYEDGNFRPGANITREEMCVVLENYRHLITDAQPEPVDFTFPDDEEISSWAKEAVYNCYDYSLISATSAATSTPRTTPSAARPPPCSPSTCSCWSSCLPRRSSPRTRTRNPLPPGGEFFQRRALPSPPLPPEDSSSSEGGVLFLSGGGFFQ